MNLDEQLRSALRSAIGQGRTISGIARDAEMTQPQLSEYLSGIRQGLTTATASRLMKVLGLSLTQLEQESKSRKQSYR